MAVTTPKMAQSNTTRIHRPRALPVGTRRNSAPSTIYQHMVNWVYFPKSSPPPEFGLLIVSLFEDFAAAIDSTTRVNQHSDSVMARLRPGPEKLGFLVEKGKGSEEKIVVPVLFGRKGKILK